MAATLSNWAVSSPLVLALFLFRCVPFLAYVLVTPRVSLLAKLGNALLFAGLIYVLQLSHTNLDELRLAPLMFAYLAVAAGLLYQLVSEFAISRPGAVFALAALLFVVVPAAAPRALRGEVVVGLGFEIMLAAYSFFKDTAKTARPPLSEYLFFLLVNPTLVFAERGQRVREPGYSWRALVRCLFGVLTMFARLLLVAQVMSPVGIRFAAPSAAPGYIDFVWRELRFALGLYWAHSGLASMQIGLMQCVGYEVPERYRMPFLAKNPQEFWKRWNLYVATWAERYLFRPVSHALPFKGRARALNPLLGAFTTFLVIGFLHDFALGAMHAATGVASENPLGLSLIFALFACTYLLWVVLLRRVRQSTLAKSRLWRSAGAFASWLVFAHLILVMAWVGVPALMNRPLPLWTSTP